MALLVAATAGCGSDGGSSAAGDADGATAGSASSLSFYPLQFVVERVGGQRVESPTSRPAGVEPHDLELTADGTARSRTPTSSSTSPGSRRPSTARSTRSVAETQPRLSTDRGHGSSDDDVRRVSTPTSGSIRLRLADVADAVAERLADDRPRLARPTFTANAAALRADLDGSTRVVPNRARRCASTATSSPATRRSATSPRRYGLTQVGITGLTPEDEPSPADLAAVDRLRRRSRRDDDLLRDPRQPRRSPRPSPTRPAPARRCSTRSRACGRVATARTTST